MSPPPTIAIVGRPNVGKSTLFNRLTGTRAALVSDRPGLTRDRRAGEAEIGGHPVAIIDTAGLEEAAAGTIPARMRAQTEVAIRAADLILFVVDARAGVIPADEAFARLVRASGRPSVLVANKCEGRAAAEGALEAFALGLGEPVTISAEHGLGIGDLHAEIAAALGLEPVTRGQREADEEADTPADDRPIRIAIIGRPNAGKSTLVNALLGEERMITGPEPGLTRDAVSAPLQWGGRAFEIVDTAGLRRKAKVIDATEQLATSASVRAMRMAEVVILLVDAERALEHQDLTLGEMAIDHGRALVVAVNKWDLVADKARRLKDLRETVAEKLAQAPGLGLVAISAQAERGLDKLMTHVIGAHQTWNRRVSTPALNRWLRDAVDRHAPPAASGRRIKLRFITQPSTRPPTFVAFCSRPEALPRSYIRYLTNSLRETFDLPGVPLRFELRKGDNPYA